MHLHVEFESGESTDYQLSAQAVIRIQDPPADQSFAIEGVKAVSIVEGDAPVAEAQAAVEPAVEEPVADAAPAVEPAAAIADAVPVVEPAADTPAAADAAPAQQ